MQIGLWYTSDYHADYKVIGIYKEYATIEYVSRDYWTEPRIIVPKTSLSEDRLHPYYNSPLWKALRPHF
jgi:hypothetical protein